jgi:hypothetical protein
VSELERGVGGPNEEGQITRILIGVREGLGKGGGGRRVREKEDRMT